MTALAPGALATPLELYERGLATRRLALRLRGGDRQVLPVTRWLGGLGAFDHAALGLASGPVLDVGCGPGRHLAALRLAGVPATGIDVSEVAVGTARRSGADVVLGCVFDPVPGEGAYGSALLLDGNIGIGGDAVALLTRIAALLSGKGGRVLAEVGAPGTGTHRDRVRLEVGDRSSAWFHWSRVDADGIESVARGAGLVLETIVEQEDRWLAVLDHS